jgi:hypothetical protein
MKLLQKRSLKRKFSELLPPIRTNSTIQYTTIWWSKPIGYIWCRYILGKKRQNLGNTLEIDREDTNKRTKQAIYRYQIYNIALCIRGTYWEDFHNSNSSDSE